MKIKLTNEQMRAINDGENLMVNGEEWEYIDELDIEEDEQGRYFTYIFKRPSDDKHFMITLAQARYGYEDYGYESFMQDFTAYEVKQKEVKKIEWVYVN
jgi:hypothetical protein